MKKNYIEICVQHVIKDLQKKKIEQIYPRKARSSGAIIVAKFSEILGW